MGDALSFHGITLGRVHAQRLREMYRSSGWPCLDSIEIELLAAGLLERATNMAGPETLRVTDSGIQFLAGALERNRAALNLHDALVMQVAAEQVRNRRIAYCGPMLRAKPAAKWVCVRPDVFSIRNTSVAGYIEPVVFEIKVQRSDLKSDLKKPDKRAAYIALSSQCYYVLAQGIAQPDEVPPECGVIVATGERLDLIRAAPRQPMTLSFGNSMALFKADRFRMIDERRAALL